MTIRTINNLVSIIIPTYIEINNIALFLSGLDGSLKDILYKKEVIDQ
jgi:hypothetical protein